MRLLILVALLTASASPVFGDNTDKADLEPYRPALDKIVFPDRSKANALGAKYPDLKYIIDWAYDKENWAKCYRQIHQRIGLHYKEGVPFTLQFEHNRSEAPAYVQPRASGIVLIINLPVLHAEVTRFKSIGVFGIISHELAHVVQFGKGGKAPREWPTWLVEGMGTYVTDVEDKYIAMWAQKEPPHTLDEPIKDQQDAPYAWGHLFLEYLKVKYGKENLDQYVSLLINKKTNYKKAAEEVTKKKWSEVIQEELDWKKTWLKDHNQKNKDNKKK